MRTRGLIGGVAALVLLAIPAVASARSAPPPQAKAAYREPAPIRVFESGAILLHLAEKFGALLPAPGAAR